MCLLARHYLHPVRVECDGCKFSETYVCGIYIYVYIYTYIYIYVWQGMQHAEGVCFCILWWKHHTHLGEVPVELQLSAIKAPIETCSGVNELRNRTV